VVRDVPDLGGPILLSVETPEKKEVMIPFVRAICREIDVVNKVIHVDLPEGLLDL
jgi:16S rRNA processing protein RimM